MCTRRLGGCTQKKKGKDCDVILYMYLTYSTSYHFIRAASSSTGHHVVHTIVRGLSNALMQLLDPVEQLRRFETLHHSRFARIQELDKPVRDGELVDHPYAEQDAVLHENAGEEEPVLRLSPFAVMYVARNSSNPMSHNASKDSECWQFNLKAMHHTCFIEPSTPPPRALCDVSDDFVEGSRPYRVKLPILVAVFMLVTRATTKAIQRCST